MTVAEVTLVKTHDLDVCTSHELKHLKNKQWQARCSCDWEGKWWNMEDSAGFEGDAHLAENDPGDLQVRLSGERFAWRCGDCGCLNRAHEIFCYLCGAGDPWDED